MNDDEVYGVTYDWADTAPHGGGEVVRVSRTDVNPVTGHGAGCLCPRCPSYAARPVEPVAPARKPNALLDQVVPVSILLVVFTVCTVVLIPFIAPLMTSIVLVLGMGVVSLAIVAWLANKLVGSRVAEKLADRD